jgi:glycosyltransferase involved in cell wall biosynthesis
MPKTLLYLSESEIPSTRANAVQIAAMCSGFAQAGVRCSLVHIPSSQHAAKFTRPPEGAGFDSVPIHFQFPLFKGVQVARFAKRTYSQLRPEYIYGRSLASILAVGGSKGHCAFEAHMIPSREFSKAGILWRLLSMRSDIRLVCISEALKNLVQARYKIPASRILVYHDCAHPNEHISTEARITSWTSRRLSAVYAGTLSHGKGIEIVLKSAVALPEYDFKIVGGDKEAVKASTGLEIPPNVECLGRVSSELVARHLANCQIALLPNQPNMIPYGGGGSIGAYNSPLKLFEYMAAGCVVVASDLPNIREVLPEHIAFYAEPTSNVSWVAAIRRAFACDDYSVRVNFVLQAVAREYNWRTRATSILSFLSHV